MEPCRHKWIRRPGRWECDICFEDVCDYSLGDDSTPPNERPISKDQQIADLKAQVDRLKVRCKATDGILDRKLYEIKELKAQSKIYETRLGMLDMVRAACRKDNKDLKAQVAFKDRVIELMREQWPHRVKWAEAKAGGE